jgi:O-antigen ligase
MSAKQAHIFPLSTVVLLGWGAFAFGSEYSWAYAPLLIFSVVVGVLGLLVPTTGRFPARAMALALAAIFAAGLLQLVPLSQHAIRTVSPASVLADYQQLYAKATMQPVETAAPMDGNARRPLSIAPWRTVLGLTFLAAFGILLVGCARGIGAVGPHGIARGILVLGLLAALLELMQRASASDVVYGFWYPPQPKGYHSAPFVNRNHTAGWLLMALSLSAGCFAGALASGLRRVRPGWRHRILWLSSRQASETLLIGFAIVVMAISIVATASRSGSICLALVILAFGSLMVRRQTSGARRIVAVSYLLFVVFAAVSLGGVGILALRFADNPWWTVGGRIGVWLDTIRIVRDFPWTGTGLNTYGIAMLHYQTVQDGSQYIEAHNDYLQLLAEGGLLLGVPILVTVLLFIREVWRRFREAADDTATYWVRAGAVTGILAIAFQAIFDFTLQMPGAAALFVVLVAIAIHRPSPVARQSSIEAGGRS